MTSASHPGPPRSSPAGFVLYLLVPGTFFLLGCLLTWFALKQAPPAPSVAPSPEPAAGAAEPDGPTPAAGDGKGEFLRADFEPVFAGAATLAGAGTAGGPAALGELALLQAGEDASLWKMREMQKALPLREGPLKGVVDGTPVAMLPSFRQKDKQGQVPDLAHFNDVEAEAFCEALFKANLASPGAFANSARRDLTFADLFNAPKRHRGEVVHFEGQLRRVRRGDAPAMAKGVRDLYEGWAFDANYGANPVCLVFPELPAGLSVAERLDEDVTFDGYFFKKYRYQSADSKPGYAREAPLFIGHSPVLRRGPAAAAAPPAAWSTPLLIGFLGLLLATGVLAFGLHWWFRRGDRRVRDRLAGVRHREFVEPGSPGLPDTTPSPN
jgi:hypothetical protein